MISLPSIDFSTVTSLAEELSIVFTIVMYILAGVPDAEPLKYTRSTDIDLRHVNRGLTSRYSALPCLPLAHEAGCWPAHGRMSASLE